MWYDSEVYGGHAKSNVALIDIHYGPNNKKEAPCDSCSKAATCGYECKAFTAWCDTGNYWEGGYVEVEKVLTGQSNGKVYFDYNKDLIKKYGGLPEVTVTKTVWKPSDVGVFKKSAKKVA